ncbi:MAG: tRNA preQ1(34) S-adenosylmethionine ribosyltransferase-isomerase QueA [Azonexus sp.]|nr:tRNA preQ1(34) S-adenosylmethionine ribosyltransferase-isomerase QueA [Betaproteobacteria bacterium]MBK8918814.1 tRNA preQ1(34) S-adenosylmethionine ribosyltransferase-isomerase QueA [Betaproteobacteria bacterium]MBP6034746.1 tRNA preQ1(34) S-adenosylmethionine ribosyltransferase-isomerase QueA [Azonexus sp.]MBP6905286.1 tRNA preQ1(34) S-adenosylmethionine ribosyltransferase-isomerase QueA [Azonexus sp.]
MSLSVEDFDFPLPPELIAQHPAAERRGSRLLHVRDKALDDLRFTAILDLIAPGDLLVFNDTKVIKARLYGEKPSGGKVEVMLERIVDARHAVAQVRASKAPRPGSRLRLADAFEVEVTGRAGAKEEFFALELVDTGDLWQLAERHGHLPLPPYITHAAEGDDETRYQTVYAREPGAVAAPTAGLHFDESLLAELRRRGVGTAFLTLHVGAGTFKPVRVEKIAEHRMHSERFDIPDATAAAIAATRAAGGRIVAVGTTSLRALESAAAEDGTVRAGAAETDIFITPGYRFRGVDRLITNFHLPRSTLLMLVSAFAGYDTIRAAYAHAVAQGYRFFSYGDAMLLEPAGR